MNFTEHDALVEAVEVGKLSPCMKSKRGVVLFHREEGVVGKGFNHPPRTFRCDGSDACRENCARLCIHAEAAAFHNYTWKRHEAGVHVSELEMLHVKVVDGQSVASGPPSCWQCSPHVVEAGIKTFWLLHEDGLKPYEPVEFHEKTLRNRNLPIIR